MSHSDLRDCAHSLLDELLSFGVNLDTVERALCGAVTAERESCAATCDAVAQKSGRAANGSPGGAYTFR